MSFSTNVIYIRFRNHQAWWDLLIGNEKWVIKRWLVWLSFACNREPWPLPQIGFVFMEWIYRSSTLLDVAEGLLRLSAYCDWCRFPSILIESLPILSREFQTVMRSARSVVPRVGYQNTRLLGNGVMNLLINDVLDRVAWSKDFAVRRAFSQTIQREEWALASTLIGADWSRWKAGREVWWWNEALYWSSPEVKFVSWRYASSLAWFLFVPSVGWQIFWLALAHELVLVFCAKKWQSRFINTLLGPWPCRDTELATSWVWRLPMWLAQSKHSSLNVRQRVIERVMPKFNTIFDSRAWW